MTDGKHVTNSQLFNPKEMQIKDVFLGNNNTKSILGDNSE